MVVFALFATNKKRPLTSTAAEAGFSPAVNGEPGTAVNAPEVASTAEEGAATWSSDQARSQK